MAQEYKIVGVSEKVRNWSSQHGAFSTYTIMLDGFGDEAIQLNKKSDSPAPKEDDIIYGDITETEFGKKFKSVMRPKDGIHSDTSKQKPDAFLRDATTVPIDMIKALLPYFDVQSLKSNSEQYNQLMELAQDLTEDALKMVDSIRNANKAEEQLKEEG